MSIPMDHPPMRSFDASHGVFCTRSLVCTQPKRCTYPTLAEVAVKNNYEQNKNFTQELIRELLRLPNLFFELHCLLSSGLNIFTPHTGTTSLPIYKREAASGINSMFSSGVCHALC